MVLSLTFHSNPEPELVQWFVHNFDDPIESLKDIDVNDDFNGTRHEFNSSVPYEFTSLRVSFVIITENNL